MSGFRTCNTQKTEISAKSLARKEEGKEGAIALGDGPFF
jgi:hypothetical protein